MAPILPGGSGAGGATAEVRPAPGVDAVEAEIEGGVACHGARELVGGVGEGRVLVSRQAGRGGLRLAAGLVRGLLGTEADIAEHICEQEPERACRLGAVEAGAAQDREPGLGEAER